MSVHHIYLGASPNKVWCGKNLGNRQQVREAIRDGRIHAPLTEGEYRDGVIKTEICPDCVTDLTNARPI